MPGSSGCRAAAGSATLRPWRRIGGTAAASSPASSPLPAPALALALLALAVVVAVVAPGAARAQESGQEAGLALLDAVTLMLENDPNIGLAEAGLRSAEGSLLVERSSFDPLLTGSLGAEDSETPTSESSVSELEAQSLSVGVDQLTRFGLSVGADVGVTRTEDTPEAVNVGSVTFTLRQPLARGRGRDVVTASERSAELGLDASRLDLRHRIAERIFAVAAQYWSVAAAAKNLEVLRESENRARASLDTYRRLVRADQVPAADLVQLEADVVAREVSRLSAEQTLFARRQQLGQEIGLDAVSSAALPLPSDPFPRLVSDEVPQPLDERYLLTARQKRADFLALQQRLEGARTLNEAARNGLLPQIDLVLTPSYTGFVEGDDVGDAFTSLTDNVPGLSTIFGVSVSWPVRNRAAEGILEQSLAGLDQRTLQIDLLENSIGAQVTTALDAVRTGAEQLERAVVAVGLFSQTVVNEDKKLQVGRSTLLDTITQRDRLTSARLSQTNAELNLAVALARLRFQTGTLLEPRGDDVMIDHGRLTTVPFKAENRR